MRNESMREKEPTEVVVLAGFLGAGKTTLLKRVLSWETTLADTVVLVNEFGDVGIDGGLLGENGADMVELTSGCICCTLKVGLIQALADIASRISPKRLFIETTGVADPFTIKEILAEPTLRDKYLIKKIVTVLDADFWEAREIFGPIFENQLKAADLILLNKIDTVESDDVPRVLDEIHETIPESQIVPTIHCRIDPETFFSVRTPSPEDKEAIIGIVRHFLPFKSGVAVSACCDHAHGDEHAHDCPTCHPEGSHPETDVVTAGYVSFSFQDHRPLDESLFKAFLRDLPWEVFRVKGDVKFEDRSAAINFVGGKNELTDRPGTDGTRLAFVGWNVEGDDILERLNKCVRG